MEGLASSAGVKLARRQMLIGRSRMVMVALLSVVEVKLPDGTSVSVTVAWLVGRLLPSGCDHDIGGQRAGGNRDAAGQGRVVHAADGSTAEGVVERQGRRLVSPLRTMLKRAVLVPNSQATASLATKSTTGGGGGGAVLPTGSQRTPSAIT